MIRCGEEHPDLLVVVELGMPLQRRERGAPRFVVARRVELEPVALAEAAVALGPEVGAGPGDREVDVEDDCSQPCTTATIASGGDANASGTLAAFRSRDFRLLWGGQTISFVGDAAFIVALGWRVTDLTGKASSLGFVLASSRSRCWRRCSGAACSPTATRAGC